MLQLSRRLHGTVSTSNPKGLLAFAIVAVLGCSGDAKPTAPASIELVEKFVVSADTADIDRPFRGAPLGTGYVFGRSTLSDLLVRTDSTGQVVGFFGPKGTGPNELAYVGPMMPKGDSLMIMDFSGSRIAVVAPTGKIVRTITMESLSGQYALRLRGDSILQVTTVGTEAGFGYPLHLSGPGGPIVRSFGTEDRTVDPANAAAKLRIPIAETDSTFWVAHFSSYVLERWHINGTMLQRLEPTREWFPSAELNPATPEQIPQRPSVVTAGMLDDGRLAVVLFRPQADVKPFPAESLAHNASAATPQRILGTKNMVLEILDPKTGALLGSRPIDRDVIRGSMPHGRLFGIRQFPDGSQHAVIWQIRFSNP